MPSLLSQLSQLCEFGVRIPAFPAAALPPGLLRFADAVKPDGSTRPHEDAYQASIERWCDRIEALHRRTLFGQDACQKTLISQNSVN